MGYIAPRGPDNSCCDCTEWNNCDCGVGACALECESKEGTAYLCGFDEYTDVSSPPRFYKQKTFAGAVDWTIRNTNCAGSVKCEYTDTLAGSISKNPASACSESGTGTVTRAAEEGAPGSGNASGTGVINGSPGVWSIVFSVVRNESDQLILSYTITATGGGVFISGRSPPGSGNSGLVPSGTAMVAAVEVIAVYSNSSNILVLDDPLIIPFAETCAEGEWEIESLEDYSAISRFSIETTRVQKTATPTGASCQSAGTEGQEIANSPVLTETLSDEDTEDAAEARANEAIGAWQACTSPCLCSALPAYRSLRVSGNLMTYRSVRVRANGSELTPNTTYTVRIRFYRRAVDSGGAYLFYAYQETSASTGPGETTAQTGWIDVPNEAGWETIAGDCAFLTP